MSKVNKEYINNSINIYKDVSEYLDRNNYSTGIFSNNDFVDRVVDEWYQIDLSDEFGTTNDFNLSKDCY